MPKTLPKPSRADLECRLTWLRSWRQAITEPPPAKRIRGWEQLDHYVLSLMADTHKELLAVSESHERN